MQARLSVRADTAAIRLAMNFASEFATEHGIDAADQARICVLLDELIVNLLLHGYPHTTEPGRAEIGLSIEGANLNIEFIDDGVAFDPLGCPRPDLDQHPEARPVGGLGLLIVRDLSDEASYQRIGGRNVLRLSRRVSMIRRPD